MGIYEDSCIFRESVTLKIGALETVIRTVFLKGVVFRVDGGPLQHIFDQETRDARLG
jgi:hypothetical protein